MGSITETSEAVQEEAEGVLSGLSGEVAKTLTGMADLIDKLVDGMTHTLQTSSQLNELTAATELKLKGLQGDV